MSGARQRYTYMDPHAYKQPNAFLSALLSFCAVVSLCGFILLLVLRAANTSSIIQNTDVLGILEDADVAEQIVAELNRLPFHNTDVELADIEEFIKSDAVSDEIGSIIDDYARAFAAGDLDHHLTSGDIVDIARNLEPEFKDLFDHEITEEQYEQIARAVDDAVDLRELSVGNILEELDVDPVIPGLMFSPYWLWGVGILCALLLLFIFLRRRRNIADAMLAAGIPIVLSGLLSFGAGLFIGSFPQSLGLTFYTMARFLGGPAHVIMQYGLGFAATGAAVVLVSFVFKAIAPKT